MFLYKTSATIQRNGSAYAFMSKKYCFISVLQEDLRYSSVLFYK